MNQDAVLDWAGYSGSKQDSSEVELASSASAWVASGGRQAHQPQRHLELQPPLGHRVPEQLLGPLHPVGDRVLVHAQAAGGSYEARALVVEGGQGRDEAA